MSYAVKTYVRFAPIFTAILLLFAGCARHQVDTMPQPLVEAPQEYSMETRAGAPVPGDWWNAFGDDRLNDLVETGFAQNLTVAQSLERIERANHLLRQAWALGKPTLDLSAEAERSRRRERLRNQETKIEVIDVAPLTFGNGTGTAKQSTSNSSSGGSSGSVTGGNKTIDTYDRAAGGGLSLSWELDLWGRLRSEVGARSEELTAAMEDYEGLRLLLAGQIADAYYRAVEQRLQMELLAEQHESTQNILELLELRLLQGSASIVDVLQQRGQLAEIEAEIPVVEAELRLYENRLDVLTGNPPDGADRTASAGPAFPTETELPPLGVPADLLQNRPDLRALRRRTAAADYRIASAIAERLPRVTLNGSLLYSEEPNASSLTVRGLAGLVQPLVDWGQRQAAVLRARSEAREAVLAFSEAYLVALEEVETTLWRESRQVELIDALARRAKILEETVKETRVRYGLGVTDYLPVLTAVQDLQQVQRELLRQRRALVLLRIELYRAAGGVVPAVENPKIIQTTDAL